MYQKKWLSSIHREWIFFLWNECRHAPRDCRKYVKGISQISSMFLLMFPVTQYCVMCHCCLRFQTDVCVCIFGENWAVCCSLSPVVMFVSHLNFLSYNTIRNVTSCNSSSINKDLCIFKKQKKIIKKSLIKFLPPPYFLWLLTLNHRHLKKSLQ